MTTKDIKDPATRAHVEEMAVLLCQYATKHGISEKEAIEKVIQNLPGISTFSTEVQP